MFKEFLNKVLQYIAIILLMIFVLTFLGGGSYLIFTSFGFDVIKFIIGVASFSISLVVINFVRQEFMKPNR